MPSGLQRLRSFRSHLSRPLAQANFAPPDEFVGFTNAEDMAKAREESIKFFVEQYQIMLTENLDDYTRNFDRLKQTPGGQLPDDPT